MDFKRDQSAGYIINHLARLFASALQARIEPMGASVGQFPLLLLLWEEDGLSQTEISTVLGIEKATVTNTLNRMERDRLITRSRDPNDARRSLVHLTPIGQGLQKELLDMACEVNGRAAMGVSREEHDMFLKIAKKMIANLEADKQAV
jgi:DNA-binding MarR family transcriptional regulator